MFSNSRISKILKLISRGKVERIVRARQSDRYSKKLSSWNHLVAMLVGQLSGSQSLRDIELLLDNQENALYHMGINKVKRSTLSDANLNRDSGVFKEISDLMVGMLKNEKKELKNLVTAIDSSIIRQEGRGNEWSKGSRPGSRGLKLHLQYDNSNDHVEYIEVTDANINDVNVGQGLNIEQDRIYVFDKGYADYNWWSEIDRHGSKFVTRLKKKANYKVIDKKMIDESSKDFIKSDKIIELTNKSPRGGKDNKLFGVKLRLVSIKHPDPKRKEPLSLVSNDIDSEASVIAGWYKERWSVELMFKWLKQNLKLKKFIGESRNAAMIQIYVAIISYVLLKLYKKTLEGMCNKRLKDVGVLLKNCLFERANGTRNKKQKRRGTNLAQLQLFDPLNSFARIV